MSPLVESRPATRNEEKDLNWFDGQLRSPMPTSSVIKDTANDIIKSINEGRVHRLLYRGGYRLEADAARTVIRSYLFSHFGIRIQSRIRHRKHDTELFIKERPNKP